jgi:hypothetical protein
MADKNNNTSQQKPQSRPPQNPPPRPALKLVTESYDFFNAFRREKGKNGA